MFSLSSSFSSPRTAASTSSAQGFSAATLVDLVVDQPFEGAVGGVFVRGGPPGQPAGDRLAGGVRRTAAGGPARPADGLGDLAGTVVARPD